MYNVVVIGGNHHNTLGVVRSLGRKGIKPVVILETEVEQPFVSKSKYISELFVEKSDSGVLNVMVNIAGRYLSKAVVIACSDELSSLLDTHKMDLEHSYYLPCSNIQGRLTELMDKQVMSDLAVSVGLQIPKSFVIDDNLSDYSAIPYPCIVKPLVSKVGKKSDITICQSEKELRQYDFSTNHSQVQQYIDKSFEYQLIGCSLNNGNEVIIPGRSIIIHQPYNTNTAYLRYEPLDGSEPIDICKDFLKATGYSGLFSMEFLRGKDGLDYFMEINFRNDGNAISVTDSGINLPYIWVKYCTGSTYKDEIKSPKSIYVIPESTIVSLWYSGSLSTIQMIKDFWKADTYMDFAKDDPAPTDGLYHIYQKIIKLLPRVIVKSLIGQR